MVCKINTAVASGPTIRTAAMEPDEVEQWTAAMQKEYDSLLKN
jgi:hypothetical protein